MGVDQGKWNFATVCEFFVDRMENDINASALGRLLYFTKFTEEEWDRLDELMREWQVRACVIDADPNINDARRFARKYHGYVWLCRYRRGQAAKEVAVTEEDGGAPMVTCDRTNWLAATLGRFKTNRIEIPADISLEYREHLKALVRTYKKDDTNNSVATYVNVSDDHFCHSLNYCELALPFAASLSTGQSISKFL
jgi:hypothetical protein